MWFCHTRNKCNLTNGGWKEWEYSSCLSPRFLSCHSQRFLFFFFFFKRVTTVAPLANSSGYY